MKIVRFIQISTPTLHAYMLILCSMITAAEKPAPEKHLQRPMPERVMPIDQWQKNFIKLKKAVPTQEILTKELPQKHQSSTPEPMYTVIQEETDQGIEIPKSTLEMSHALKLMAQDFAGDTKTPIPLNAPIDTIKSAFFLLDAYKHDPKGLLGGLIIKQLSPDQITNVKKLLHNLLIDNQTIINDLRDQQSLNTINKKQANLDLSKEGTPAVKKAIFTITGKDQSIKGIEISKEAVEMSNTLINLLSDMGNPTEGVVIPLLKYSTDTIRSVFGFLEWYSKDGDSPRVQQGIKLLSLSKLIPAINLLQDLGLKDEKLLTLFTSVLNQEITDASSKSIVANKEIIDSLNPDIKQIYKPLRDTIMAEKRIELLKNKGSVPVTNEFISIDIGFAPTATDFSHDVKKIALGKNDGTVVVFDTQTGKQITEFSPLSKKPINAIKFSHDDKLIALAQEDSSIIFIYNAHTYEKIQSLNANRENDYHIIENIMFSPDDTLIVSGNAKGNPPIIIWQRNKNKPLYAEKYYLQSLDGRIRNANVRDFSSDGANILLTNPYTRKSFIWSIKYQKFLADFEGISHQYKEGLRFNIDNTKIVSIDDNSNLVICNIKTLEQKKLTPTKEAYYLSLSPDTTMSMAYIISSEKDSHSKISLIDTRTGNLICYIDSSNLGIQSDYNSDLLFTNTFSPNNNKIALCESRSQKPGSIFIIDLLTQKEAMNFEQQIKRIPLSDLILKTREMSMQNDQKIEKIDQQIQSKTEDQSNRPTLFLKSINLIRQLTQASSILLAKAFGGLVLAPILVDTVKYATSYLRK